MTRLTEWMNVDSSERDDYSKVIEDKPTQVDVYRIGTSGTEIGFSDEVPDYSFLKRLVARIDQMSTNSHRKIKSGAGEGIEYDLLATTFDTDVKMKDRWYFESKIYSVVSIDDQNEKRIEVFLRYLRDECNI